MTRATYQRELSQQNKAVALVKDQCGKNHTVRLRLKSGHCMECSPQGIAHWKRRQEPGHVYIAKSARLNRLKIGTTKAIESRNDSLFRDGYAGVADWIFLYHRKFEKAGTVEDRAQTALDHFKTPITYTRKGHGTEGIASEIFDCDYTTAREAIERFADSALGPSWER